MMRIHLVAVAALLGALAVPVGAQAEQDLPEAATRTSDGPSWASRLNPFDHVPLGSRQYAGGVVEAGMLFGSGPGHAGGGYGIHYLERGSLLAQMLMNSASAAGAGARAQQTGRDQTYTVDVSPRSNAGIGVDILGGSKGSGVNFDLFYGIPMGNDDMPWVLDFGLTMGSWTGIPDATKAIPHPSSKSNMYMGFIIGSVIPITYWAQLEPGIRLTIGDKGSDWFHGHIAAVGNIGNRIYARLDFQYFNGLGTVFGMGVRL